MNARAPIRSLSTLLGVAAICAVVAATTRPTTAGLNVLIITLDTTRADRIGAYGSRDVATPNLDWLAHTGVVFEQAMTVAPLTLPAHCSLFTGRFPPGHRVRENAGFVLAPTQLTLPEVLRARGFRTGAFPASVILGAGQGLSGGFDVYADEFRAAASKTSDGLRRSGDRVVDRAIGWLERARSSRFFAWVHLYDAHAPYDPPEPYRTIYAGRPYDGCVAFMDAQVGRLLAWLRRQGLLDRTVIVVVADHGESLGEHGEWTHALRLYESVLHVPLIVRAPLPAVQGRRVGTLVRTVDVMPTVLALLSVPPPAALDGVSLVRLLTGATSDLRLEAYAETEYPRLRLGWPAGRAVRVGRFKLIRQDDVELYDVMADPGETRNIAALQGALVRDLGMRLGAFRGESADAGPATPCDEIRRRQLAALGYVSR